MTCDCEGYGEYSRVCIETKCAGCGKIRARKTIIQSPTQIPRQEFLDFVQKEIINKE
jgi:hypothetical protein